MANTVSDTDCHLMIDSGGRFRGAQKGGEHV